MDGTSTAKCKHRFTYPLIAAINVHVAARAVSRNLSRTCGLNLRAISMARVRNDFLCRRLEQEPI